MSRLHAIPLSYVLLVLLAATASAQPRPAAAPATAGPAADEQQLRQAVVDFVKLYNEHKAAEVAALFAQDGRMVFKDGSQVDGRAEIQQSFEDSFRDSPDVKISVVVDSIRLLTPDVAVEEGSTSLFPDGDTLTSRDRYTVLHLKRNGRWQMQSVRVVEEESISAYGELKSLEWLVGSWIDEGREENIEANFRWDENKSFLLEDFQVIREGEVVLKGTQRIGWDPQAKQIRSWVFDSAGGFGEAAWTPVNNDTWMVKAHGVLPDGTSASATRTLQRAAPHRVVWESKDRLSGAELHPDLAVTMVRKAPQAK